MAIELAATRLVCHIKEIRRYILTKLYIYTSNKQVVVKFIRPCNPMHTCFNVYIRLFVRIKNIYIPFIKYIYLHN